MQPENQYDFIMNDGARPKKKGLSSLLPTPQNKTQRIIFVVVAGLVLLMLVLIVGTFIFGGGGADRDKMVGLIQKHAEVIRVAEIGTEKARSPEAKNLAATTKVALQSSQAELKEVVETTGKVGNKELSGGQNSETDEALQIAEQRNRFDEEFIETLTQELTEYRTELKAAYDSSSSDTNKQVYSNIFNQLSALLPETTSQ